MYAIPARGAQLLAEVVGQRLCHIRRWVFSLGIANDERGHGLSELEFEHTVLVIRPGPNEDYIEVERGPCAAHSIDTEIWSEVKETALTDLPLGCRVTAVDFYSDGVEDVAIVLRFEEGRELIFAMVDTDLVIAPRLDVFELGHEPVVPKLRATFQRRAQI